MCESVVKRNRIAKVIIAMFLLVAICFSVACTGEIKETEASLPSSPAEEETEEYKTKNGKAKLEDYFRTEKLPYEYPLPEEIEEFEKEINSAQRVRNLEYEREQNAPAITLSEGGAHLFPKKTVKIIKIICDYYWNFDNHNDFQLERMPDEWITTSFKENFRVYKDEYVRNTVEITPKTCTWLKEIMTPTDCICFEDYAKISNSNTRPSYNFQVSNLKIYFVVI